MVEMVACCEACEKWFCSSCDEESGVCPECGRPYCGSCKDVVCCPKEDD